MKRIRQSYGVFDYFRGRKAHKINYLQFDGISFLNNVQVVYSHRYKRFQNRSIIDCIKENHI